MLLTATSFYGSPPVYSVKVVFWRFCYYYLTVKVRVRRMVMEKVLFTVRVMAMGRVMVWIMVRVMRRIIVG